MLLKNLHFAPRQAPSRPRPPARRPSCCAPIPIRERGSLVSSVLRAGTTQETPPPKKGTLSRGLRISEQRPAVHVGTEVGRYRRRGKPRRHTATDCQGVVYCCTCTENEEQNSCRHPSQVQTRDIVRNTPCTHSCCGCVEIYHLVCYLYYLW